MNGVHDMGGMDGFGKVEPEPNEPPFHENWEGRVLAMKRAMGYAGAWHIDMSRVRAGGAAAATYLAASYYWRWALGMEKNLLERGFVEQTRSPPAMRCIRASRCRASSRSDVVARA